MRSTIVPAGLLVVGCLWGQSASPPLTFEVASIKRGAPDAQGFYLQLQPGGGLKVVAATLKNLLAFAYSLREFEISGGPEWAGSDRFDISARAGSPTVSPGATGNPPQTTDGRRLAQEARERVKTLLAERFQLTVHRESREQNVYVLVVAKTGPKFGEAKPDSGNLVRGRAGSITGQGVAIQMLVVNLSNQLGRPVLDRTGLAGKYDFKLEWTPDSTRLGLAAVPTGSEGPMPAEPVYPSLFAALQEQLGLRLESQKAAVEMLVIDHVDKPSEN
jgi:uncharacterized protein (TIGR03435 family)